YDNALILAHGDNLAEKLAEFGFAGSQDATTSVLESIGYLSGGMVTSGNGRVLALVSESAREVTAIEMSYVDQSTLLDNRFYYGGSNIYKHPDTVIAGLGVEEMATSEPSPGTPGFLVSFDGTTRPVELHFVGAPVFAANVLGRFDYSRQKVGTGVYTLEAYSPDADSGNDSGHSFESLGQEFYNIPADDYVSIGSYIVPNDNHLVSTCHVDGEEEETKGYEAKVNFENSYPLIPKGDYIFEFGSTINSHEIGTGLFICKALNENPSVQAPRAVYRADEGINQFGLTTPAIPRQYAWPHLIDEAHWAAALVLSRETTLPARSPLPCDLNQDGRCSADDVNLITSSNLANEYDESLDLNSDNLVNELDSELWISDSAYMNSYIGDSNLDGVFDSADLVLVFAAAQYEDGVLLNSGWAEGDWNSDGEFDSADLIAAFSQGGYDQGPRPSANVVPEPTGLTPFLLGLLCLVPQRSRQTRGAQVHTG
ncbi:MAG: hypothetical protein KDA87_27030, partial [Planctomycetales bacterium]|nr:hypothetical protein [Planctomycetales bacterium]